MSVAPLATSETAAPANAAAAPAPAPAAAKPNFVGVIDKLAYGRLSGWAVTMEGMPCDVIVNVNGADLATVRSDQPRPDLAEKKLSRGQGGWQCELGQHLATGRNKIEVRFADGSALRGSPFEYDSQAADTIAAAPADAGPKTYVGAIDIPNADVIAGWSIGSDFKAAAVVVTVNDSASVVVQADADRPDLIAQHLTQSGGGWQCDVRPMLQPGLNLINVTYPDGKHLPGSPIERQNGENPPGFVRPQPLPEPKAPVATAKPQPAPAAPKPAAPAPQPAPAQPVTAAAPQPAAPSNIQAAMSPFTRKPVVAEAEPAPATNVTPFPSRTELRPGMPSLSELDELSLDDISLAIAAGMINVAPSAVYEPVPDPEPTEAEIEHTHQLEAKRRGFFSRLLGRG